VAQQEESKRTPWQAKIALMRARMEVAATVVLLAASLMSFWSVMRIPTSSGLSGAAA
jgi:hypothetical protein